jgi:hypothetical protein
MQPKVSPLSSTGDPDDTVPSSMAIRLQGDQQTSLVSELLGEGMFRQTRKQNPKRKMEGIAAPIDTLKG